MVGQGVAMGTGVRSAAWLPRVLPWRRGTYVVRVDVGVIPLQPVIQDRDDHALPSDALLPHGNHMQVQLREGRGGTSVLLERKTQEGRKRV